MPINISKVIHKLANVKVFVVLFMFFFLFMRNLFSKLRNCVRLSEIFVTMLPERLPERAPKLPSVEKILSINVFDRVAIIVGDVFCVIREV